MSHEIDRLLSLLERELDLDARTLSPDSRLAELADSLDWVNLIGALEDSFGLRIGLEDGLRLQTLQDLMALVMEHRLVPAA
jgi:acyl carrier protein